LAHSSERGYPRAGLARYDGCMSCSTEVYAKIEAVVGRWMDSHPAEVLGISIWNFFEDQSSLDIVVSIQQADGIRRLTLDGQRSAPALTPAVEDRILNWLDNLSNQPTVDHSS